MIKPWLWLPPKLAHDLSPFGLKVFSRLPRGADSARLADWDSFCWKTSQKKELQFINPLGIAGGLDKNALSILDWQKLGCGFLEIGTVTPIPQSPNSGKIMDRDIKTQSLWNKMGFPSDGADVVLKNIETVRHSGKLKIPLFINLGKNRVTSNENAHLDYNKLMTHFQNAADAFVVNISSPNTTGLRNLAKSESFKPFLAALSTHHQALTNKPPLLLKLSPDLNEADFSDLMHTCLNYGIDGFILTNTTTTREGTPFFPLEGGVSGKPLQNLSLKALESASKICSSEKSKKIIISTGGVMTAADVFERIERGADLVQVYSTLIFEGPLFFRKVAKVAEQREQKSRSQNFGSNETSSR